MSYALRQIVNRRVVPLARTFAVQVRPRAPTARLFSQFGVRLLSTEAPQTPSENQPKGKVHEFRAETKKLLDIVAHSLYSEKEIFVRELISNASDALEKLRYLETSDKEKDIVNKTLPLEIKISTDPSKNTLTIEDSGIGMNEQEAIQNLGTIAHSGSKSFLDKMSQLKEGAGENIIGQFGVGFYSAFMVGNKVKVYSKSAFGGSGILWESDGSGHYEIQEDNSIERGTRIVIDLKEKCYQFSEQKFINEIIKKYSNFIHYPIIVNGQKVNTLQPLWTLSKDAVTPEMHKEFYTFLTNDWNPPAYHLHYSVDSPLMIRALLYVPTQNSEFLGKKFDNGVSIYCRKVLIKAKASEILPPWLRFISGVCDSEDIPLNLSREMLQDSSIITKIKNTLTNKIISWFQSEATKDPKKFDEFYSKFHVFFEEGIVTHEEHREKIAPLLRYKSSMTTDEDTTTLQEYITRMKADQKQIYFMLGKSKDNMMNSPYMEQFISQGIEVLFVNNAFSEFALKTLGTYQEKEIVSADSSDLESQPELSKNKEKIEEEMKDFTDWFKNALGEKIKQINISTRLVSHPVSIADREMTIQKNMFEAMQNRPQVSLPEVLEINPNHQLIKKLNTLRTHDALTASLIAAQIYDGALFAAGFVPDNREHVARMNNLLEQFIDKSVPKQ